MVLLGAPGAGKGTQAKILVKEYNLLHISTGDMLRETVKSGTELGLKIKKCMESGELVSDEIVTKSVIERMSKDDAKRGVILDGYPRTRSQAEAIDISLKKENRSLNIVVYMKVTEKVVLERLCGRRLCPKCGKIYHTVNMPPKKEGICDIDGAELIQRKDDKPETIKNRLDVYDKQTKDLIDYYAEKGILRELDGGLSAKELFDEIDILFKREGLVNDDSE